PRRACGARQAGDTRARRSSPAAAADVPRAVRVARARHRAEGPRARPAGRTTLRSDEPELVRDANERIALPSKYPLRSRSRALGRGRILASPRRRPPRARLARLSAPTYLRAAGVRPAVAAGVARAGADHPAAAP